MTSMSGIVGRCAMHHQADVTARVVATVQVEARLE